MSLSLPYACNASSDGEDYSVSGYKKEYWNKLPYREFLPRVIPGNERFRNKPHPNVLHSVHKQVGILIPNYKRFYVIQVDRGI